MIIRRHLLLARRLCCRRPRRGRRDAVFHAAALRLLVVLLGSFLPIAVAGAEPDFDRHVAPILQRHCLSCHDEPGAEGGVRLDRQREALQVIVPGEPDASAFIAMISGAEPAMPLGAPPLTPSEVAILRQWISAGAAWPAGRLLEDRPRRDLDWWSLRPIQPVAVPTATAAEHPVDALLAAAHRQHGLQPVESADAATLLRRLCFDLTGLPPTPRQLAEFSLDRYEQTVDALLASPAFGERWARHWLDVARYAETHGYDKDKPRTNAWPYRDWVIRSFNADKPYDQFVQQQIAGDALFPGEPDGVLGLAFLAAGPWDLIGHVEVGESKVDGRIAKHLDRDEMMAAVYNVFLSTTVQCAQCHHHKFDPLTMEDYYRLHAVFAAVDRADRLYDGLDADQQRRRDELQSQLAEARRQAERLRGQIEAEVERRASDVRQAIRSLEQAADTDLPQRYGWHSAIASSPDQVKWVQVDLGQVHPLTGIRLIPAVDHYAGIGPGFGFPRQYRVEVSERHDFAGPRVVFDSAQQTSGAASSHPGRDRWIELDGRPVRTIRVTATELAPRRDDFIFALAELQALVPAGNDPQAAVGDNDLDRAGMRNVALKGTVTSRDSIESAPRWGRANLTDDVYYRELGDPQDLARLWDLRDQLAAIRAAVETPPRLQRRQQFDDEIRQVTEQLDALPPGRLVYAVATDFDPQGQFKPTGGQARPIHLLRRGDIRSPAEPMRPGMTPLWPAADAQFDFAADSGAVPVDEAAGRAALARAITSDDNPLLWRSIVNRLWAGVFAQPLVDTPNDFGRMGDQPTHPELLDYLAGRLRDDPHRSLKSIIRLLVTSGAYRRSSANDEANSRIDADNRYLWRANRRRLSAEEFRDLLLVAAAALRTDRRGGPSFQDFVIEKPQHSPHYQYHQHSPDDPQSHRRSIYRFVVRSQPQPLLTTLDCADPSISVAVRDESTTALQALAQWNNVLVEWAARRFGKRIQRLDRSEAIDWACRLVLSRPPDGEERAVLQAHLRQHGEASLARVLLNLNALVYLD